MAAITFTGDYLPGLTQSAFDMASRGVVDVIRRRLPAAQVERGDARLDRARALQLQHLEKMSPRDQAAIKLAVMDAMSSKALLNSSTTIQKFLRARRYKQLSKTAYALTKDASDRVLDVCIWGHELPITSETSKNPPEVNTSSGSQRADTAEASGDAEIPLDALQTNQGTGDDSILVINERLSTGDEGSFIACLPSSSSAAFGTDLDPLPLDSVLC